MHFIEFWLSISWKRVFSRFGFMPDMCPMKQRSAVHLSDDVQPKYVHCTGGMFAMIPDTKTTSPRNKDGTHKQMAGSFNDYIALQSGVASRQEEDLAATTSFYKVWQGQSWWYMQTRHHKDNYYIPLWNCHTLSWDAIVPYSCLLHAHLLHDCDVTHISSLRPLCNFNITTRACKRTLPIDSMFRNELVLKTFDNYQ